MGSRMSRKSTDRKSNKNIRKIEQSSSITVSNFNINIELLRDYLLDIIDVNHGLLDKLRSWKVLSGTHIEVIKLLTSGPAQVSQLLNDVIELSSELQDKFMLALEQTQQKHVVNFINCRGNRSGIDFGDCWPMISTYIDDVIEDNYETLIELIDTRHGLLEELLSIECISSRQKDTIEAGRTHALKNESLISILCRKSIADFHKFVQCLVKTKQLRVAALIAPDTVQNVSPLSRKDSRRICANLAVLVELIDTKSGLVGELYAADCITRRQKEYIESASSLSESSSRLLELVERGSQADFEKFTECLAKTGQLHVSRIILEGGVVATIDAKTTSTTNVAQTETLIVELFNSLPVENRMLLVDKLEQGLQTADVGLITLNTKHSIRLFIICKSFYGVRHLNELYCNKKLKDIVMGFFKYIDNSCDLEVATLDWNQLNRANCMAHFRSANNRPIFSMIQQLADRDRDSIDTLTQPSSINIELLPFELIEMIVIAAAGQLFVRLHRITPDAEVYTLVTLRAVSLMWWEALCHRKYVRRLLKRYFKKVSDPFRRSPQLMTQLRVKGERHVRGIAELNGIFYVACVGSDKIQTCTSEPPFSRLDDVKVRGLKDPSDIVVCSLTSQLYIADWTQSAIWRVNLLSSKQDDTCIAIRGHPRSLSVYSNRVLITQRDGKSLFLYGSDGSEMSRTRLPRSMFASHAVETNHKTFVVSHGNAFTRDTESHAHSITEVDVNGRVVRTLNNRQEDMGTIQFNMPRCLVLDNSGHVIVADSFNERIILLKPDLQLKRILIDSLDRQPRRLCLSKSRYLFIGYFYSTRVDVYAI